MKNSQKNTWPKVINDDLLKQANSLKNKTFAISGQIKGTTQLPIPTEAENIINIDSKDIKK